MIRRLKIKFVCITMSIVTVILLCVLAAVLALLVITAWPVLSSLLHPGDYTATVALNWGLSLPSGSQCVYEADSGSSFHGDGERYHVLEYAGDGRLEQALAEQATPLPSAENPVTEILDDLSVPADQRPDFADCGVFTADHPSDDRNRLYLLVNSAGTRLYVVEFFL